MPAPSTRTTSTRQFYGTLYGQAWGGFEASLDVSATLKRGPVAAQLAALKRDKGGDFQSCDLAGAVVVERRRVTPGPCGARVVVRERVFNVDA